MKEIYTEMYGEIPKPKLEKSMHELTNVLSHAVRELDDVYQINNKVLPYDNLWLQDRNTIGLVNISALPKGTINKLLSSINPSILVNNES